MIKFSASNNSFYDTELQYNNIPSDAVEISQDKWDEIMCARSLGQIIVSDGKGYPKILPEQPSAYHEYDDKKQKWIENTEAKEAASKETTLNEAKAEYARLMQVVNTELLPLNDAADLLIISEPEIERRKKLQAYRVYLSRVPQQEGYPDVIGWPEYPL